MARDLAEPVLTLAPLKIDLTLRFKGIEVLLNALDDRA
jgi:hypothetical protein